MSAILISYAGDDRGKPGPRIGQFRRKTALILSLWRDGLDTVEIARRCRCSPAYAANELARARDEERRATR